MIEIEKYTKADRLRMSRSLRKKMQIPVPRQEA